MFEVMAGRCDQCLFGKDKIVSDERRRDLLRKIAREDVHFVCHKATIARGGRANVCCRGDYDRDPGRTNLMRIAGRLGAVRFVTEAEL